MNEIQYFKDKLYKYIKNNRYNIIYMYFYLKIHFNLDKVTKVTLISKARGISM